MRRSLQLVLFAVVLLGLVGGLVGFAAAEKSVTLLVDGQSRSVDTYAATIGEVLADEGVTPGEHDVVLPGVDQQLADGDTALSVDEALEQLGYRSDDLVLSASRSERLPLDGMALTITTPKDVVLVADGRTRTVTTTAATAGDLLTEQGITLSETDRLSLYPDQQLLDRMRVQVFRVVVAEKEVRAALPFDRVEVDDPDAFEGEETVVTPGQDGERVTTVKVTRVDGKVVSREELATTVTREPVTEEVRVGTKERPAAPAVPSGSVWDALAACEAGGNWAINTGNGYYGGLQFHPDTWASYGGQGLPHENSREQQIAIGEKVVANSGGTFDDWPGCRAKLGLP